MIKTILLAGVLSISRVATIHNSTYDNSLRCYSISAVSQTANNLVENDVPYDTLPYEAFTDANGTQGVTLTMYFDPYYFGINDNSTMPSGTDYNEFNWFIALSNNPFTMTFQDYSISDVPFLDIHGINSSVADYRALTINYRVEAHRYRDSSNQWVHDCIHTLTIWSNYNYSYSLSFKSIGTMVGDFSSYPDGLDTDVYFAGEMYEDSTTRLTGYASPAETNVDGTIDIYKDDLSVNNSYFYDPYQNMYVIDLTLLDIDDLYYTAFNTGYNTGYTTGYEDGYSTGIDNGYNNGYTVGYNEGSMSGTNFGTLLFTIADVPVYYLRQLFNIELFGVKIYTAIFGFVSLLAITWIIRKVT